MATAWEAEQTVLVNKSLQGRAGRFPARILEINGDEVRLQYFWYPHDVFYNKSKRFYVNEILNSSDCATVQRDQLLELIAVVFTKDYITHDVEGCKPENVFVCYSTYNSKDRTIRIFKSTRVLPPLPHPFRLVPRAEPRRFVPSRIGEHEIVDEPTAIPIVFVADADIPVHIRDIVVVSPPPSPSDTRAASMGLFGTLSEHRSMGDTQLSDGSSTDPEDNVRLPGRMAGRELFAVKRGKPGQAEPAVRIGDDGNEDCCGECRRPGNLLCCDGCPRAFHFGCVGVREETLGDAKWFCPVCVRARASSAVMPSGSNATPGKARESTPPQEQRKRLEASPNLDDGDEEIDDNDDFCAKCRRAGNLLCCDGCPRSYHFGCAGLRPADLKDDEKWFCAQCRKSSASAASGGALANKPPSARGRGRARRAEGEEEPPSEPATPKHLSGKKRAHTELEDVDTPKNTRTKPVAAAATADLDEEPGDPHDPLQDNFANADLYFATHGARRKDTSDNTLSGLAASNIGPGELRARLLDHDKAYVAAMQPRYQRQFAQWIAELLHGFSVLCIGIGSKRPVLREFAEHVLAGSNVLVVNGYFAATSIKGILDSITQDVLGYQGSFKSPIEQVRFVREVYTAGEDDAAKQPLFLVIHNIDGPTLRSEQAQTVLSLLASTPQLHMIASIDHINAPFLWDQARQSLFNWVMHDATTYALYLDEITVTTKLTTSHNAARVQAAMAVLESQPPAARKSLWILASMQHAGGPATAKRGVRYVDYLQMCQHHFVVHDDARLRKFVSEYRDHELIAVRMSQGVEVAAVTLERQLLATLLEKMKETYPSECLSIEQPQS